MNKQINIGWAQTDITPDRPVYVIGQLYSRISSYVHDPITATCLVLENGVSYPVVSAYDASLNYKDICKSVKDFTAALHVDQAVLNANPDITVTLELIDPSHRCVQQLPCGRCSGVHLPGSVCRRCAE